MKSTQTTPKPSSLLSSTPAAPLIIAGPCSAETEEQVLETARQIKSSGVARVYRAGIWKPRTRPNSFEGVGRIGLGWLQKVKQETGLPLATEVANARHVAEALAFGIDILWIGARTSVNPFSVQEIADSLAGTNVTVLVKNPINPDLALWIGALERLAQAGLNDLGAIHRGFSTDVDTGYRNAPKWNLALEFKKQMPQIPLICDPSHIGGRRDVLQQLSQKALDLGMQGLMIESHIDPDKAWSDAKQQISPQVLANMLQKLGKKVHTDTSEAQDLLEHLNHEIYSLDYELIELLSRRARVSGKLANSSTLSEQHKFAQTLKLEELKRNIVQKAKTEGLAESYIQSVFEQVYAYSNSLTGGAASL